MNGCSIINVFTQNGLTNSGGGGGGGVASYFNFTSDDMLIVTDLSSGVKNLKETTVNIDEVVQLDKIQTITNKIISGGSY